MKVILTGVTGFLGEEVLRQSVAHPKITEIVAIARRDVKKEHLESKKVTMIKTEEFGAFSDENIEKLKGADGCIWTLGTVPGNVKKENLTEDDLRRINVEWPLKAAEIFASVSNLPGGKKFQFINTSGFLIPDPDQKDQKFWIAETLRKVRLGTDLGLIDMEKEGKLDAVIAKPAFITEGETLLGRLTLGYLSVTKQAMAACLIDSVVSGRQKQLLQNADLRKFGAEAQKKLKDGSK